MKPLIFVLLIALIQPAPVDWTLLKSPAKIIVVAKVQKGYHLFNQSNGDRSTRFELNGFLKQFDEVGTLLSDTLRKEVHSYYDSVARFSYTMSAGERLQTLVIHFQNYDGSHYFSTGTVSFGKVE